jgi:hypothetical protein
VGEGGRSGCPETASAAVREHDRFARCFGMLATTRLVRAWKRTSSCTMAECAGLPAGVADEFDPSRGWSARGGASAASATRSYVQARQRAGGRNRLEALGR